MQIEWIIIQSQIAMLMFMKCQIVSWNGNESLVVGAQIVYLDLLKKVRWHLSMGYFEYSYFTRFTPSKKFSQPNSIT
jgi:hypothetical protein